MSECLKDRLLSLLPDFRRSTVWSFQSLDRLIKNDFYFRHRLGGDNDPLLRQRVRRRTPQKPVESLGVRNARRGICTQSNLVGRIRGTYPRVGPGGRRDRRKSQLWATTTSWGR